MTYVPRAEKLKIIEDSLKAKESEIEDLKAQLKVAQVISCGIGVMPGYIMEELNGHLNDCKSDNWKNAIFTSKEVVNNVINMEEHDRDWYCRKLYGLIEALEDGSYKFRMKSDDGSVLWLNNELVIDNDGYHAPEIVECEKTYFLSKGSKIPFLIHFFEGGGGAVLRLEWQINDEPFKTIPTEAFKHLESQL